MEIQKIELNLFPSHSLQAIPDPPSLLYVLGNIEVAALHCIAIVGTRRPSSFGIASAYRFAAQLAQRGFCIVSGLARGIDAAAHRGALSVGGFTLAVLGHGLDRIYPSINRSLAKEIIQQGGGLISEYEEGTPPLPHHFPLRNRIVSGLSAGVVVIEATQRSGSLITARLAGDHGREVYVVPGRFDDPLYAGSHDLIQQGARLVTDPELIVNDLAPTLGLQTLAGFSLEEEERVWGRFFAECDFTVSLEEMSKALKGDYSRAYRKVEELRVRGLVIESQPQEYIWVGPSIK